MNRKTVLWRIRKLIAENEKNPVLCEDDIEAIRKTLELLESYSKLCSLLTVVNDNIDEIYSVMD